MTTVDLSRLTDAEAAGIQSFDKPAAGSWTESFGLDTGPVSFRDSYDPEFYEDEKEAVFRRSWLQIGRVEQLPRRGSYFTKELEFLGVSILVVRGMDDEMRAFHNVCSHRGNKLMWDDDPSRESSGNCRQIACKYHGWRYELDGGIDYVHNAPEFFDLRAEDLALPRIHCDTWAGFVFVNLDDEPRQALREFLTPDVARLETYPFHLMTHQVVMETEIRANWKLYMDAFQELYHVPYVHGKMNNPGGPATGVDKVPVMVPYFGAFGKHRVITSGGPLANAKVRGGLPLNEVFGASGFFGPDDVRDVGPLGDGVNPSRLENWGLDSWQLYPNWVIVAWGRNWYSTYSYWPTGPESHKFEYTMNFVPPRNATEWLANHYTWFGNKEFATQDANTLEATQSMLRSRDEFRLCDQEVAIRHLHTVVQDDVEAYRRELSGAQEVRR